MKVLETQYHFCFMCRPPILLEDSIRDILLPWYYNLSQHFSSYVINLIFTFWSIKIKGSFFPSQQLLLKALMHLEKEIAWRFFLFPRFSALGSLHWVADHFHGYALSRWWRFCYSTTKYFIRGTPWKFGSFR